MCIFFLKWLGLSPPASPVISNFGQGGPIPRGDVSDFLSVSVSIFCVCGKMCDFACVMHF